MGVTMIKEFSSVWYIIFLNENYMQYINDTIYTSHAVITEGSCNDQRPNLRPDPDPKKKHMIIQTAEKCCCSMYMRKKEVKGINSQPKKME